MTDWPSWAPSFSATTRVITSVGPPAGNGITILRGFEGHVSACAESESRAARIAAIRASMGRGSWEVAAPMVASGERGGPMTTEVAALVFDAYGTLFDVHSVAARAEALFAGQGAALSTAWRTKQLEYTWLRTLMGGYEDFDRVTRASLDWSLEALGLDADEAARRALIDEYRRLATFPEVPAVLEALARSRPLAILSNGHPEMLEA